MVASDFVFIVFDQQKHINFFIVKILDVNNFNRVN